MEGKTAMRKLLMLAACGGLLTSDPAAAYWHAGGVTPGGTAWHATGTGGGYRWGGAYHYGTGSATVVHGYGGVPYGGYYRAPVPVTPWYHPAGTFAAGVVTGTAIGAGAAAASAAHYSQPPTVVNNYYGGN
jgi:hypothetical protein